jgi:D-sedoheptulose 7-phosphate isomerase
MRTDIKRDIRQIKILLDEVLVTNDEGATRLVDEGLAAVVRQMLQLEGGKVLLIGNGASASISSHVATDLWKNGHVRATAFNDSALLTCIGNDYGYDCVFEKPIEMFGDRGDILVAISSSGQSENILKGVAAARRRHMAIFTFSGFRPDNPLRQTGDINFYVPSSSYGHVEVVHHALCHVMINAISRRPSGVTRVVTVPKMDARQTEAVTPETSTTHP